MATESSHGGQTAAPHGPGKATDTICRNVIPLLFECVSQLSEGAAEPESYSPVDPKGVLWDLGLEIWRATAAQERQGWPGADW